MYAPIEVFIGLVSILIVCMDNKTFAGKQIMSFEGYELL